MTVNRSNLRYTKEHEWVKIEGEIAVVGITDFATSALGDIVFMELPEVGRALEQGNSFGVVESIKSVSDLYAPVSGEVVESNDSLAQTPDQCGKDPFGSWMIKIRMSNRSEANQLLDAAAYKQFCDQSAH